MRRAFLLAGLFVLAGCTGLAPGGEDPTSTDTPDVYPDRTTALPDGPKAAPDRPATLNESSVRDYVRTFEYRYVYNTLWRSEHTDVNVECEVDTVTREHDGYRVTVSCYGYANTHGETEGNTTATAIHADWGTQSYTYYVDEETTVRLDDRGTPSPA